MSHVSHVIPVTNTTYIAPVLLSTYHVSPFLLMLSLTYPATCHRYFFFCPYHFCLVLLASILRCPASPYHLISLIARLRPSANLSSSSSRPCSSCCMCRCQQTCPERCRLMGHRCAPSDRAAPHPQAASHARSVDAGSQTGQLCGGRAEGEGDP